MPLLHGERTATWPAVALVEHKGGNDNPVDPDFEGRSSDPTTYAAIRISAKALPYFHGQVEAVYVEYADPQHEIEFYDINKDPYEIDNIAGQLTSHQRAELHAVVAGLQNCHNASACLAAGQPQNS